MAAPHILVAGIGNIFFGDDAFGSEVARRLLARSLPAQVRVIDFGIRGIDLTYALLDGYALTILIDATPRGGAPGTLYTIEPDLDELDDLEPDQKMVDTHSMNPLRVLALAKSMGSLQRILLVGCEPVPIDPESDGEMGLSEPVAAAIDEAIKVVESLIDEELRLKSPQKLAGPFSVTVS